MYQQSAAIHAVLAEPKGSASLLPTMPVLPSASSYLPSQLSSLSTTFTSAGTLPRSATPAGKSVAQRRAQAPPIQVSELRKAPKTDFDAYLAEIRDEYDRWQHEARLAAAEAHVDASFGGGPDPAKSRAGPRDEVLPPLDDIPRIFFDSTFNLSNPRTFDLVTERIQLTPDASPSLSKLSAAFDEPAVHESGRTSFDHVPGLGPETLQDLAADQVLQDKLSHYTAVIESHLVREIGLRSSSFFAALSNLQALHQQGQDALGKIAELQGILGTERGGVGATARHGLSILQAQARRRGLERIEESVRAVDEIWTAVQGVKDLVENGEWDGALEVGEQIEAAYYASATGSSSSRTANGERPSPPHPASSSGSLATSTSRRTPRRAVNLTKLRALASLPSKLALLRTQIAKSLEGELVTVLEHELDAGIDEHVKLAKAGRRWKGKEREKEPNATGQPLAVVREDEADEELQEAAPETRARERVTDRIRPVVRALVRADGMDSAITAWRDSVLREIRALVREVRGGNPRCTQLFPIADSLPAYSICPLPRHLASRTTTALHMPQSAPLASRASTSAVSRRRGARQHQRRGPTRPCTDLSSDVQLVPCEEAPRVVPRRLCRSRPRNLSRSLGLYRTRQSSGRSPRRRVADQQEGRGGTAAETPGRTY